MNITELRERALEIGKVTEDFDLEIEELQLEEEVACFAWKHRENEDNGIWIEISTNGTLLDLNKDLLSPSALIFSEKQLYEMAIDFVLNHYPSALQQFAFEEWKREENRGYRLSYVQKVEDLALPHTGFWLSILEDGEVVLFKYMGIVEDIRIPQLIMEKEKIKERFLRELEMELQTIKLSNELYNFTGASTKLVYEPSFPFSYLCADGTSVLEDVEEDTEEELELVSPPKIERLLNELIGFNEDEYEKIRDSDLGDEIGSVWRPKNFTSEVEGTSINDFFQKRNQLTLKFKHDKKTNHLRGVFSFLDRKGELFLNEEQCKKLALEFLFTLYPNADEFLRMVRRNSQDEEEGDFIHFHFNIHWGNVRNRFGSAWIGVNRTTGTIDHYLGPDMNLEDLKKINSKPDISIQEAVRNYQKDFDVKLEWKIEYQDHTSHYVLVYVPDFPRLEGKVAFIDAQNGEVIVSKEYF